MRLMPFFYASLQRELRIYCRSLAALINPLLFFVIIISLFPLAITPDPNTLQSLAPGVIWIACLLTLLLSLDRLFSTDHQNGTLEQIYTACASPTTFVIAKLVAYWLSALLPLILLAPLLAVSLQLDPTDLPTLLLSLLLATPTLCLLAALGAALTLGSSHHHLLLSIIILPLVLPLLIFGAHCTILASHGEDVSGLFALLGAIGSLSISLLPLAINAALKITLNQS